tara:strand:- start:15669 stop:15782 length:114 start_codon:yes stop_codon:yes gene_type:complete
MCPAKAFEIYNGHFDEKRDVADYRFEPLNKKPNIDHM